MNDDHTQLVSELRALVDTMFDRLEPILRNAADPGGAHADGAEPSDSSHNSPEPTSGCSWCPVCAVAALVRGEQHDLVTLVAGQLSALIALLRELLDEYWPGNVPVPNPPGPAGPGGAAPEDRDAATGFVPISVTIKS